MKRRERFSAGIEGFVAQIEERLRGKAIPEDVEGRRRFSEFPSWERIEELVQLAFGVDGETARAPGTRGNVAGKVCLFLEQSYGGLGNRAVGQDISEA